MKKNIIFVLVLCLSTAAFAQEAETGKRNFDARQLWKNAHLNFSVFKTPDYRWLDLGGGTALGNNFAFENRLSWKAGLDLNWNRYTLYNTGTYTLLPTGRDFLLSMWSLSVPVTVNYEIYKNLFTGINLYTGPVYEQILTVQGDNLFEGHVSRAQFGWTAGTRVRFFAIFSLRISYDHYFTGLFTNGELNRSAIRISLGF